MNVRILVLALLLVLVRGSLTTSLSQDRRLDAAPALRSGGKAFGLSLLVPGLGQRYVQGGTWGRNGMTFLAVEAGAWFGLSTAVWRENQAVSSFETLAALEAGADLAGKNRSFLIGLGTYDSSDELIETLLRSRRWDRLEGAQDPDAQWNWSSTDSRKQYSELRDRAESLDRRASLMIGTMVANRLISAVTALRAARRHNRNQTSISVRISPDPYGRSALASLSIRW